MPQPTGPFSVVAVGPGRTITHWSPLPRLPWCLPPLAWPAWPQGCHWTDAPFEGSRDSSLYPPGHCGWP